MIPGLVGCLFWRVPQEQLVPAATGTPIGQMTKGGGLGAAFDGNTAQGYTTGAYTGAGQPLSSMWIGKTFSSRKVFSKLTVYSSYDQGFQREANPDITLRVRGKNGSPPTSATDGTIISDEQTFSDISGQIIKTLTSIDTTTAWDHIFLQIEPSANNNACCSEVQIWELG